MRAYQFPSPQAIRGVEATSKAKHMLRLVEAGAGGLSPTLLCRIKEPKYALSSIRREGPLFAGASVAL